MRLDVEVNTIEAICGVPLVELQYTFYMVQHRFPGLAWFVRVDAVQQRFNADVRFMQQVDELWKTVLQNFELSGWNRHIDFVDPL